MLPACRRRTPAISAEQGRFADAVRPDERRGVAGADGQAHVGQRRYLAVAVGDLADFNCERLSRRHWAAG